MDAAKEARIRDRAYAIWEREGRPQERDREHWQQAELEVAHEEQRAQAQSSQAASETGREATTTQAQPAGGRPHKPHEHSTAWEVARSQTEIDETLEPSSGPSRRSRARF
jgi:hypothetical protein